MGSQPVAALPAGYAGSVTAAIRSHAAHLTHVHHLKTAVRKQVQLAAIQAQAKKDRAQGRRQAGRDRGHRAGCSCCPGSPALLRVRHPVSCAGRLLWLEAGGPAWAESHAVEIASCESGFNPRAYNPSGATGLWQILGSVVPGDLTNPSVNAANAVAKFRASGDTFAQWVCQ